MLVASLFITLLPWTTEYIQTFIDGRNYDKLDIVADVIGIFVGALIYFLFKDLIRKIYSLFGEQA